MSYSQTKTSKGYIPFSAVERTESPQGNVVSFDLIDPERVAELAKLGDYADICPRGDVTLADLASIVRIQESDVHVDHEALLLLARKTGPLFGSAEGIEHEKAWSYAAYTALLACRIQECVNGRKPLAALSNVGVPRKAQVVAEGSQNAFTVLDVPIRAYGEYGRIFSQKPLVRHSVVQDAYEYSFALRSAHEANDPLIEFIVVSMDHEMGHREFKSLLEVLGAEEREKDELSDVLPVSKVQEDEPFSTYELFEAELNECDMSAIEALVQLMIVAHMGSVQVDMFNADQETGYLAFDAYLSWLWYEFSKSLTKVTMGYCVECGRAFSLQGHRGMSRKYCSRACKTNAKNGRTKSQVNKIRSLFLNEGLGVDAIASALEYPKDKGPGRVRDALSRWVQLKHAVCDELEECGIENAQLFRRCVEEGLSVDQLLSNAAKERLKDELKRRSELNQEK